jgi:Protein of unknown function (DUF3800)
MNIFIDESGTFVASKNPESWNSIAAYVLPERIQTKVRAELAKLKKACGVSVTKEIKLNEITEKYYEVFLYRLGKLSGCLFAIAIDSGQNPKDTILAHQADLVAETRDKIRIMIYESGKRSVEKLAHDIDSLSPQLYVQMRCQVTLINDILHRGLIYYVQRDPVTLGRFKWRIDQKTGPKARFERTFKTVIPILLQSMSLREPLIFLEDADYSYFKPFEYADGQEPAYLRDYYGIDMKGGINVGKIVHDNVAFPDSKHDIGVQIADLLASGIRRCLRGNFANNERIAALLGVLMIQNAHDVPPLHLLGFNEYNTKPSKHVIRLVRIMQTNCRRMLVA